MKKRIVLLHATHVAMRPVHIAFSEIWPEAETVNLLDDGLTIDRAKEAALSDTLTDRFVRLGQYGHDMHADGILVTCSAFGPAIDKMATQLPVPVLKPNEAMFLAAIKQGKRIGMLATFAPSVGTMTEEFEDYVERNSVEATLKTILVDRAIDCLRKGDEETHNSLIAARAAELADCDAIMLAHFSTSSAAAQVRQNVTVPVLTAPHAAVERMRELVEPRG